MLIIFNYAGVAFVILALFGGWAVKFAAWALGFEESANDFSFVAAWCAVAALIDLVCRSAGILNSSPRNWLRFIAPSNGGHLFFIPIWILTSVLLGYQVVRMFG
ncbi:MAG TPA: hypothetical protein VFR51_04570 [Pyrinomonadaceae bacterium]|nr:hypothetical protein [Pyrinomonadaceae bacterium]